MGYAGSFQVLIFLQVLGSAVVPIALAAWGIHLALDPAHPRQQKRTRAALAIIALVGIGASAYAIRLQDNEAETALSASQKQMNASQHSSEKRLEAHFDKELAEFLGHSPHIAKIAHPRVAIHKIVTPSTPLVTLAETGNPIHLSDARMGATPLAIQGLSPSLDASNYIRPFLNLDVRSDVSGTIEVESAVAGSTNTDSERIQEGNGKIVVDNAEKALAARPAEKRPIYAGEGVWFSVMGPPFNQAQYYDFTNRSRYLLYFGGVVRVSDGRHYWKRPFCYMNGGNPDAIVECPNVALGGGR